MKHEKSCGIIPIYFDKEETKVVLIKSNHGVVGFPKGHVEKGEREMETALRECNEEIGAKPNVLKGFKEKISYYISEYGIRKTVVFFIGILDDLSFQIQESEVSEILVLNIEEAYKAIPFKDTRVLLKKAENFLAKRGS